MTPLSTFVTVPMIASRFSAKTAHRERVPDRAADHAEWFSLGSRAFEDPDKNTFSLLMRERTNHHDQSDDGKVLTQWAVMATSLASSNGCKTCHRTKGNIYTAEVGLGAARKSFAGWSDVEFAARRNLRRQISTLGHPASFPRTGESLSQSGKGRRKAMPCPQKLTSIRGLGPPMGQYTHVTRVNERFCLSR